MRRLLIRSPRSMRAVVSRIGVVRTPWDTMRSSELFDLLYAQEQIEESHLQDADAATICDALVTDSSLFEISPSPLFDAAFYLERYPDVAGYWTHPFVHFVTRGFYEARQPHPLIDLRYLRSAARRAGVGLNTSDDLHRALRSADPHPLFSNRYTRGSYGSAVDDYRSPLEFYILAAEPRIKQASAWFSPSSYLGEHPDVAEAGRDALVDLLTRGTRLDIDFGLVRGVLSAHGIRSDSFRGPMPWPTDVSSYRTIADLPDPDLHGPMPSRANVVVGVVLYRTEKADFDRLVGALDAEAMGLVDRTDAAMALQLVVNDQQPEIYREWLESIGPSSIGTEVLDSGANVGFGSAHNSAMSTAFSRGANHYLGLNPDGFLMRGSLENLVRFSSALSDAALIEADTFPVGHPKWFDPVAFDTEWVSGAAFLMPRRIFEAVGGFDERFHMYCEDVDLSWRVREAGFRTVVCPTAQFYHDVAPRLDTYDPAATRAMFLSARLLGHKWGNAAFVERMEDLLVERDLMAKSDLPALPPGEPIDSAIPNFDYDLRFARSRFW